MEYFPCDCDDLLPGITIAAAVQKNVNPAINCTANVCSTTQSVSADVGGSSSFLELGVRNAVGNMLQSLTLFLCAALGYIPNALASGPLWKSCCD